MVAPLVLIASIMGMTAMALGLFPPGNTAVRRYSYNWIPNMVPGIIDLIAMRHRSLVSPEDYAKYAKQNGFNEDWSDRFYNSAHTLLAVADIADAERRGILSSEEATAELSRWGYTEERQSWIRKVTMYFPSPGDLVRFAVREVYNEAQASALGLFEEIPDKFLAEAARAGMDPEQARYFWGSHWELPSLGQAFEMLHRLSPDLMSYKQAELQELGLNVEAVETTLNDIKQLLRAQDVAIVWRDKLTALSYVPLTRVDVRRMYRIGVLNEDEVYYAYLELGYSPVNARRMADFTVKYETDQDTGLTRASIIKAYKIGIIPDEELPSYLERLDYAPPVVEFWVTMAQYEKAIEDLEALTEDMVNRYYMGEISVESLEAELTRLDLPESYQSSILAEATNKIAKQRQIPTPTDLKDWLTLGIIDEGYYTAQMRLRHYRDEDIRNYLEEINQTQDTAVRKFLPITTYQRWLKKAIINLGTFTDIAGEMDYSEEDTTRLISEVMSEGDE